MPTQLSIEIPDTLRYHHPFLHDFIKGMVRKLDINSWKDTPTMKSVPEIIENLREEVVEFEEQLALDKFNENTLIELMDAANFAFLAYIAMRKQGVEHVGRSITSRDDPAA